MNLTEAERQWAMGILARAEPDALDAAWQAWPAKPDFTWLRRPETGLIMVRGRIGGDGGPFNLGEMTVTRCALRLATGAVGQACTQGRSHRKSELAALCDALHQQPDTAGALRGAILLPLEQAERAARAERSEETAATRVQFFTRVRGDD